MRKVWEELNQCLRVGEKVGVHAGIVAIHKFSFCEKTLDSEQRNNQTKNEMGRLWKLTSQAWRRCNKTNDDITDLITFLGEAIRSGVLIVADHKRSLLQHSPSAVLKYSHLD
jgi:hypothetical protein